MTSRNDFSPARMLFKVCRGCRRRAPFRIPALEAAQPHRSRYGRRLVAYICRPLIAHLERYWMPRSLAIGRLLVVFVLAIFSSPAG